MNTASLLSIAHEAVDLASSLLATRQPGSLTPKGDRDYASEADYSIEAAVRSFLAERTPDIGFLGEEYGTARPDQDRYWVLDPIDGTVNFTHALPLCGVGLALINERHPVIGVIDHPFLSARYSASKDQGAHRDGRRLHVSRTERLADALVTIGDYAVGDGSEAKNEQRLRLTNVLAPRALRIRMLGAAIVDLAWLAEGRTDASIALSNRSWDVSAGVIIAAEAGATVFDLDGSPHSTDSTATIAAGPQLRAELIELLSHLRPAANR